MKMMMMMMVMKRKKEWTRRKKMKMHRIVVVEVLGFPSEEPKRWSHVSVLKKAKNALKRETYLNVIKCLLQNFAFVRLLACLMLLGFWYELWNLQNGIVDIVSSSTLDMIMVFSPPLNPFNSCFAVNFVSVKRVSIMYVKEKMVFSHLFKILTPLTR